VLVNSGNGIVVQAGVNDSVTLRNLQVNGSNSATHGIRFLSGKNLSIEKCRVYNFTQNGIDIEVNAASTVQITDTVVKNSGNDGIFATSTGGQVKVGVFNSQIMVSANNGVEGNSNGLVTVHRSLIAASGGSGVMATGSPCGNAGIDNSDIVGGSNGVTSSNNCWLNIGHSHLGYNTGVAYNQAGGNILVWTRGTSSASNGTNIVHDNGSSGTAVYATEQ
jgi:parallel beta helix pectate lyase-like protein